MRSHEFVIETQKLGEIERLTPSAYTGGKESLYNKDIGKQVKKLPGGSGFLYSTNENRWGDTDIKLWDPNGADYAALKAQARVPKPVRRRGEDSWAFARQLSQWRDLQQSLSAPGQLIGKLSVADARDFPLKGAVQVETITVDEDYRGVGLAKALYGIVLTIMKRPLLAGSSQTPGGRRNWVSLASIPGVEMKGYFSMDEDALSPSASNYSTGTPARASKNIDIIMGQLGGQYIGKGRYGDEYFAFDVRPNTTGTELEGYVKSKMSQLYGNYNAGLYAVWTGK